MFSFRLIISSQNCIEPNNKSGNRVCMANKPQVPNITCHTAAKSTLTKPHCSHFQGTQEAIWAWLVHKKCIWIIWLSMFMTDSCDCVNRLGMRSPSLSISPIIISLNRKLPSIKLSHRNIKCGTLSVPFPLWSYEETWGNRYKLLQSSSGGEDAEELLHSWSFYHVFSNTLQTTPSYQLPLFTFLAMCSQLCVPKICLIFQLF